MDAIDLDDYILRWQLDGDISQRLRRLTLVQLTQVTQRDLADSRNASAILTMRCNRFEKKSPVEAPACEECEPAIVAPRRSRAEKRRANRTNRGERLDRLLGSVLAPCADGPSVDSDDADDGSAPAAADEDDYSFGWRGSAGYGGVGDVVRDGVATAPTAAGLGGGAEPLGPLSVQLLAALGTADSSREVLALVRLPGHLIILHCHPLCRSSPSCAAGGWRRC